jgi:hypothetical protein
LAVWEICVTGSSHTGFWRRTKPFPLARNEPIAGAPNEAIGKLGKAPNEAKAPCSAPNEANVKLGKAPNEANSRRAERSQFAPRGQAFGGEAAGSVCLTLLVGLSGSQR